MPKSPPISKIGNDINKLYVAVRVLWNMLPGHRYGAWVVRMNRYFFHVVGGERKYRDDSGLRFGSLQDATAHAVKIASELANDGDQYRGFAISVTDEDDHELKRVPIE